LFKISSLVRRTSGVSTSSSASVATSASALPGVFVDVLVGVFVEVLVDVFTALVIGPDTVAPPTCCPPKGTRLAGSSPTLASLSGVGGLTIRLRSFILSESFTAAASISFSFPGERVSPFLFPEASSPMYLYKESLMIATYAKHLFFFFRLQIGFSQMLEFALCRFVFLFGILELLVLRLLPFVRLQ
jgi:hypothetical protein